MRNNKQTQWSPDSSVFGKAVATVRIHVERVNRQLREYTSFQDHVQQAGFDLASAKNQVCRGSVNLKPEAHCHVQDSVSLNAAAARRGMDTDVAARDDADAILNTMEDYLTTNLD